MDHQALAQLLGNYGEFVGAIAVVVTLVFVGIQVRQSTRTMAESNKLAQSTTLDESLRHFSQFRRMLATDPGLTRIWIDGRRSGELSEVDSQRFFFLAREYHNMMRNDYVRHISVGRDVYAANAVRSWATQLKEYPGLREIILRPEFDETGFNSSIAKFLEELD